MKTKNPILVADILENIDLAEHEFRGLQFGFNMIPKHTADLLHQAPQGSRLVYAPWAGNGWIVWTSNLGIPELDTQQELKDLLKFADDRDYQFIVIGPSEYMPKSYPQACRLPTFVW